MMKYNVVFANGTEKRFSSLKSILEYVEEYNQTSYLVYEILRYNKTERLYFTIENCKLKMASNDFIVPKTILKYYKNFNKNFEKAVYGLR